MEARCHTDLAHGEDANVVRKYWIFEVSRRMAGFPIEVKRAVVAYLPTAQEVFELNMVLMGGATKERMRGFAGLCPGTYRVRSTHEMLGKHVGDIAPPSVWAIQEVQSLAAYVGQRKRATQVLQLLHGLKKREALSAASAVSAVPPTQTRYSGLVRELARVVNYIAPVRVDIFDSGCADFIHLLPRDALSRLVEHKPELIMCDKIKTSLGNCRRTIMACVKRRGLLLKHASETLRNNIEVVTLAVLSNPAALDFASSRIVKSMIELCAKTICVKLVHSSTAAISATISTGSSYGGDRLVIPEVIKNNKGYLLRALRVAGRLLVLLPRSFRIDVKLMRAALEPSPYPHGWSDEYGRAHVGEDLNDAILNSPELVRSMTEAADDVTLSKCSTCSVRSIPLHRLGEKVRNDPRLMASIVSRREGGIDVISPLCRESLVFWDALTTRENLKFLFSHGRGGGRGVICSRLSNRLFQHLPYPAPSQSWYGDVMGIFLSRFLDSSNVDLENQWLSALISALGKRHVIGQGDRTYNRELHPCCTLAVTAVRIEASYARGRQGTNGAAATAATHPMRHASLGRSLVRMLVQSMPCSTLSVCGWMKILEQIIYGGGGGYTGYTLDQIKKRIPCKILKEKKIVLKLSLCQTSNKRRASLHDANRSLTGLGEAKWKMRKVSTDGC